MSPALQVLTDKIAGCTACSAARPAAVRVVGEGPLDAAIVLIGEAPGAEEERAGQPFVGPSGAALDVWLATAGLDRRQLRVLNALACRPCEPGMRAGQLRNRAPTTAELRACRPLMLQQLALLRPAVIVTIGATPLHDFAPRAKLADATHRAANNFVKVDGSYEARMQGMPPLPRPWIRMFSIWHPAGIMRLQQSDKAKAQEAVEASIARLADAREYVRKYMPERTGASHG